jgi:hypothetical protein
MFTKLHWLIYKFFKNSLKFLLLWASITFSHQECHNYGIIASSPSPIWSNVVIDATKMSNNLQIWGRAKLMELFISFCFSFLIQYGMSWCSASGALIYKVQSQDEDALVHAIVQL